MYLMQDNFLNEFFFLKIKFLEKLILLEFQLESLCY